MWKRLFQNKTTLIVLASISLVFAFPRFDVFPLAFFFAAFFNTLISRCDTTKSAFVQGFVTSFALMLGGCYWVTYVLHEFGFLPWPIAFMLCLAFCGIGALNFPLFAALSHWLQRRFRLFERGQVPVELWFALGLPALFTIVEFSVPKLFPWGIGHCLYRARWLNQIVDTTGVPFLSFCLYSAGSVLGLIFFKYPFPYRITARLVAYPVTLWALCVGYSVFRLNQAPPDGPKLRVALIQANIASLERLDAKRGIQEQVRHIVSTYERLTEEALKDKPDLILWPEAALPLNLGGRSRFAKNLQEKIKAWNTPIIAGAFAPGVENHDDFNSAYLIEKNADGTLAMDLYYKNILLAFGEYLPLGDTFPWLYNYFPQVSNFSRGTAQNSFQLKNGIRIGPTICYEDVVPSFVRKVAANGVQVLVNLTNDSWFGPTAEPYLHAAFAVFRALEHRVPLLRVTNTGISVVVDADGTISPMTDVYKEAALIREVRLPATPPKTFYLRFGNWFLLVCWVGLALFLVLLSRSTHAPLSI